MERYARVKYYENNKKPGKEGFAIELRTEDEDDWGLDIFCPLVRREGASEDEEADFIHFSALKELVKLAEYGYIILLGRSEE